MRRGYRPVVLAAMLASMPLLLASVPSVFAAGTGVVSYFEVSGGACTSTAWPSSLTGKDGGPSTMFPNNVGGPPVTAIVGTGSICIQVKLTGGASSTSYVVTSNKLSGSMTVTTDGSGNGMNEAVFTSSFSGSCTTVPLTMTDPTGIFGLDTSGQINHLFVGTGTTSSDGTTVNCGGGAGVPEFPSGLLVALAVIVPALMLLRRARGLGAQPAAYPSA